MTRTRFGFLVLAITLVWMLPSIVTGSVFVSDKPVPAVLAADMEAARASTRAAIDGWMHLRFVDVRCGADGSLVVVFEARRPFTAAEPLIASRRAGGDGWGGGFVSEVELEPEIGALLDSGEVRCPGS